MIDVGGTTIVVSGFPRSGTSMMMRVLRSAGFDLLVSERHEKALNDAEPDGVLEIDNLDKELASHPKEWTANKVIKIVAPYLGYLPLDRPVKVLFMLRPISEIVVSLLAQRTIWEQDPWTTISRARAYLAAKEIDTHYVSHADLKKYPKTTIGLIKDFIGVEFDAAEAAKGVFEDARDRMKLDKTKIIAAGKEGLYSGPQDILVLNDPNYQVEEKANVEGNNANAG